VGLTNFWTRGRRTGTGENTGDEGVSILSGQKKNKNKSKRKKRRKSENGLKGKTTLGEKKRERRTTACKVKKEEGHTNEKEKTRVERMHGRKRKVEKLIQGEENMGNNGMRRGREENRDLAAGTTSKNGI